MPLIRAAVNLRRCALDGGCQSLLRTGMPHTVCLSPSVSVTQRHFSFKGVTPCYAGDSFGHLVLPSHSTKLIRIHCPFSIVASVRRGCYCSRCDRRLSAYLPAIFELQSHLAGNRDACNATSAALLWSGPFGWRFVGFTRLFTGRPVAPRGFEPR